MKLKLGTGAVAEVGRFRSIQVNRDGQIIAVFDSSATNSAPTAAEVSRGGTVCFVVHDGMQPVGGPILIESQWIETFQYI